MDTSIFRYVLEVEKYRNITQAAKQAQQEAFVFGEHFGDARQWLQADAEDAGQYIKL